MAWIAFCGSDHHSSSRSSYFRMKELTIPSWLKYCLEANPNGLWFLWGHLVVFLFNSLFLLTSSCLNFLRYHSKEQSFKTTASEVLLALSSHCYTQEDSTQESGTESTKYLQQFPTSGGLAHTEAYVHFISYFIRQTLAIYLTYPNENYNRPTDHLYIRIWTCLKRCLHSEPVYARLYVKQILHKPSPQQVQHMADLQHKIAALI